MKFLKRDLKYYFEKLKWSFVMMIILYLLITTLSFFGDDGSVISYLFNFVIVDVGMIVNYENFFIPFIYIFLHLIPVVSLLIIFVNDHFNNGIYNILKFPSKLKYFNSKFLVMTIINIGFMLIFTIFIVITSLVKGDLNSGDFLIFLRIILAYAVENILITLFSCLFSIYLSTRISLLFILSNFSLSMLTNFPFVIGQASLVYKQDIFGGDFTLYRNSLILFLYLLIFLVASNFLLKGYDFYGDEK